MTRVQTAAGQGDMPLLAAAHGVFQPTPSACLSACVATILRIPVERTPVTQIDIGAAWFDRFNDDLRAGLGYELASLAPLPFFHGFWIAVVPSKNTDARGGHAVVMHHRTLVWDPSRGARYEAVHAENVQGAFFLVPLYPGGHPDDDFQTQPEER